MTSARRSKSTPVIPKCANCKFRFAINEEPFCRRYPPTLIVSPDGAASAWPITNDRGVCGEHQFGDWPAKGNS